MKTSSVGVNLIKENEGVRLKAYRDIGGIWTIGYGDTNNVSPGMSITMHEATQRLKDKLSTDIEPTLSRLLGETPQHQFDALVCLAYNIGVGALSRSTLIRKLRAGDTNGAANEFCRWDKVKGKSIPGLARRRADEKSLFLTQDV